MSHPLLESEVVEERIGAGRWMVVIFNNETNSMEEVVEILLQSTGCTIVEAEIEMWEAHTFGKAPVHFGTKRLCETVASVISTIGIKTEVAKEWND